MPIDIPAPLENPPPAPKKWYEQINDAIDQAFNATGLPTVTGYAMGGVGHGLDALFGGNSAPTFEAVGRSLPRSITESLLTIPEAATGVGIPVAAATGMDALRGLRLAGRVAGYGGAATSGYAETGSPLGALIGAGQMYAGNKLLLPSKYGGLNVGGRVASPVASWLERDVPDYIAGQTPEMAATSLASKVIPPMVRTGTDIAAMTGLNEATRQAMMSVGPNAVDLTDPRRNPFTEENIASNVAGAAAFLPQMVTGLLHPERVSPKQKSQLWDFLQKRDAENNAGLDVTAMPASPAYGDATRVPDIGQTELPLEDTGVPNPRHDALYAITKAHLDAASVYDTEGNPLDAQRARENALHTINEMANRGPMSVDMLQRMQTLVEQEARLSPPTTPDGFAKFVDEVKGYVGSMNEGKLSYENELASRESTLNYADKKAVQEFNDWKASQEENIGKTWHPEARDPLVLERLWKSGNLQPITPEWIQSEWNASFDTSGNPTFATRVVAQKVANWALDHTPEALKQEALTRKAVTEPSAGVRQLNDLDMQFAKALQDLPPDIQKQVVRRSVEIQRYSNFTPEQADKLGVTQGIVRQRTSAGQETGKLVSAYAPWQRAVIRAANSYDPVTQTSLLPMRNKGFQRTTLDTLVRKDQTGKYVWEPNETTLKVAAGGKSYVTEGGKPVFEKNIEGLPTKQGQENLGGEDETLFKQQLAEEGFPGDVASSMAERGGATSGENPDVGAQLGLVDEGTSKAENSVGEKMAARKTQLDKVLGELTDRQVWALSRDAFGLQGKLGTDPRQKHIKLAIKAALEELNKTGDKEIGPAGAEFLKAQREGGKTYTKGKGDVEDVKSYLRDYFRWKYPVEGGVGNLPPHVERLAMIAKKLLDPRAVELAKESVQPKASPKNRDLIQIAPEDTKNYNGRLVMIDSQGRVFTHDDTRIGHADIMDVAKGVVKKSDWKAAGVIENDKFKPVSDFFPQKDLELVKQFNELAGRPPTFKDTQNTFANVPQPGTFVQDVEKTCRTSISQILGRQGYMGTARDFYTEVAVTLAKQMGDAGGFDFFRLSGPEGGVAGVQGVHFEGPPEGGGEPRTRIGLNVDYWTNCSISASEKVAATQALLGTLAHEMTHLDDFIREGLIPRPDAYTDERARAYDNIIRMSDALTPEERSMMLEVANDAIPVPYRTKLQHPSGTIYGTESSIEFAAEMNRQVVSMMMNTSPAGRKAVMEMLDYSPTELKEYAQNTFRTVGDTMEAMKTALETTGATSRQIDKFITKMGFDAVIDSARTMSKMDFNDTQLSVGRSMVASLLPGGGTRPPPEMTPAIWIRTADELSKYHPAMESPRVSSTAMDAMKTVQDQMFSPRQYDLKNKPNVFIRWLYPFTNLMTNMERRGIPLARNVLDEVMSLEAGRSRIYSGIIHDFLKQKADGTYSLYDDHPMVRRISEEPNGRWRKLGVDAVSKWQQDNKTQSMFVQDPKSGLITVNTEAKGAQEKWDSIRSQLSKPDQDLVMGASVALDRISQNEANYLTLHLKESNSNLIATYLMAANRKMPWDQAASLAAQVHDAYLQGNVLGLSKMLPPDQITALDRLLIGNKSPTNTQGDGLIPKFMEVQQLLANRPGFRSESLPHDWIVKYKDGNKTLYASAPLEGQAIHLANRLRDEGKTIIGEVVNRNDMRSMTDFDHPDALLMKVSETENYIWDKFVTEMEQQHGAALADELRKGYSPVGQSLKELGTRGLGRFLMERKNLVDRSEFDYIDGTFAHSGRLSSSLAIRSMQQRVRLILNDPRARVLPSFQQAVNEHVAEMLQPRSQTGRQMKAFITTYMLGANLGSAMINSTQSMVTLVPWLIANNKTGGPVKAWQQMFRAAGNATHMILSDDWQGVAASALKRDPSTWTWDESMAALYRKHIENGGIQQAVIDSLAYGQDQRMLMNAKFGHGDYGPVPLSKMVADKAFMGSQMMLGLYKWVEHFNGRTAFLSALDQGYNELGLRGDDLYHHAVRTQRLADFGGGRANAPGIVPKLSTNYTRSAVGMINALQQYGYGLVATFGQLAQDSIGKSPALSTAQRMQARKAFATMFMTQTAVAGVLGLPFAGAAMTVLEKLFNIPAQQAVREGLASLGGNDDETGAAIAEFGMNGFPNQWAGIDLSSRLGTSTLLGTSAYRGFSVQDMLGPASSIVGNVAQSLNLFGQNKPGEAFKALVPNAFKNIVQLADSKNKYGDYGFRDKSGNLLYTPTGGQALAYTLGFRPRQLSSKQQLQQLTTQANQRATESQDNVLDRAAQQLLAGNSDAAEKLAWDANAADPTVKPQDFMKQIMDRAINAVSEKDILASGPRVNEQERLDLTRTFGADVNTRRSEVDLQGLRAQMAVQLGAPQLMPTADSYKEAVLIDALVQDQGMPRSQAVRLVQFLRPR